MSRARSLLSVLALVLGACASPAPIHYHTLLAPAQEAAASAPAPFLIEVLPVGVPAQVDQPQLVLRQGEGGVLMPEGERWAAPLADELRAALADALSRDLGTRDVAGLARPAGATVLRIGIQVRRFDSVPASHVLLEADWSLAPVGAEGRLFCHSVERVAAGPAYADLVRAHQQALAAVAARIAASARHWTPAGAAPRC